MGRLILVSTRLPVTVEEDGGALSVRPSSGGLASGLRAPHRRLGGLWVGWHGSAAPVDRDRQAQLAARLATLNAVSVDLSEQEVQLFYDGFTNGVLWPLFHYLPDRIALRPDGWREYGAVNARFADAVAAHYRAGDTIWVHDYQLLLLPALLRQRLPRARIGFFLHIPFPSSELFTTLPQRELLLHGMLGADLVGFHTAAYRRHFVSTVERVLGIRCGEEHVRIGGRRARLGVFPMSVDAHAFSQRVSSPEVLREVHGLRGDGSCKLLIGIDRLDYTKGIPRRLLALEELLHRRPEWRGRVRLIQVAVPSRTRAEAYRAFRQEVDAIVGRIHGNFGTPDWTPVHYLYRSIPEAQLLALYRAADVMLVTPVRDGMNLVAKEFVATRSDEDGVLVLSEFAGAAAELGGAVAVNPYDLTGSAERYHDALMMPAPERRERMRALRERVLTYDVHAWVREFLAALGAEALAEGGAAAAVEAPTSPAR